MEYLVKNGAPRCIQDIKDDLFKIRALQDFSYSENGIDRGQGGNNSIIFYNTLIVRDKSRALCEILSDPSKLQEEREFARKTRDKFSGISSTSSDGTSGSTGTKSSTTNHPAGPASGKFGGFGSEDLDKFGYNKPGQFNQAYDPYTKGASVPTQPVTHTKPKSEEKETVKEVEKKKKKKKGKKDDSDSSDSSDDDDSDSSSDDSSEDEKKKKP